MSGVLAVKRLLALSCVLGLVFAVCARPARVEAKNPPGTIGICWPTFNIELRSGYVCFSGKSQIIPLSQQAAAEAKGGIPNYVVHLNNVTCGGEILTSGKVDTTNID